MTNPATDRQKDYIRDLLDIHDLTAEQKQTAIDMLDGISISTAGKWIDRLKSLPRKIGPNVMRDGRWHVEYTEVETDAGSRNVGYLKQGETKVPRGAYALHEPSDELNPIHFFKLWIGDRGGWNLIRIVGPDEYPIPNKMAILARIAAEPASAAMLYGMEIGKCGICGRRLTRGESRARGIGPICAEKWGW